MQILRGSITSHASVGRMTLQIPENIIGIGTTPNPSYEEIPDEWVCRLRGGAPAVGREEGSLFLTRTGFNANREQLQQAFESSPNERTWEEFERYAEGHFREVERKTRNKLRQLQQKVNTLENYLNHV